MFFCTLLINRLRCLTVRYGKVPLLNLRIFSNLVKENYLATFHSCASVGVKHSGFSR